MNIDRLVSPNRSLRRINLNGLYTLDAILHAPSLTEAGRAVALSQPAMSMALRRMRDHFGDELVVYEGGQPRLTALAAELRPRIRRLLREAEDTFHLVLDFDPATAVCPVAIAAPEPVEIMFLSHLVPALLREAPGIEIRLMPFDYSPAGRMFDRGLDLVITPASLADDRFASRPLFSHRLVGMTWDQHPLAGARMSREAYLGCRHAGLSERIERIEFGETRDEPLFRQRRIVARTDLYSVLPRLAVGTDLIVTTTNWLAQYHAAMLPLTLVELPVEHSLPPMVAQWPRHRDREPMMRWLTARLHDVLVQFGPAGNRWIEED